jgi:hypothetical protein
MYNIYIYKYNIHIYKKHIHRFWHMAALGICVRAIKPWPGLRGCVWTGCERVRSIATSENANER